jgi:L-ascorbate metabolism protein UlaG (beta-lactamase superfamily)
MVITYYSGESFKVQFGDTILGFNPLSKEGSKGKIKPARFGADIAFVSLRDPLFDGVENLVSKGKSPFVIFGPGEYEIKEVFVKAYPSRTTYSSTKKSDESAERINTIYSAKLEGMHLLFLGALNEKDLDASIREDLGEVDILFVPIGGEDVLSPQDAYKLAVRIGAKLIIPMHYEGVEAQPDALKTFFKESGTEDETRKEKLTIKPRDLVGKENEVVALESSAV